MNKTIILLFTFFLSNIGYAASPVADGAKVYFIEPENGAVVTSPVTIKFGLVNIGVAPAGVNIPNTGHHHLLVDTDLPPLNTLIPTDDNHRHFGTGNTETTLELAPGDHTLQLLLGDFVHTPHDPPVMSDKITITIK